MAATQYILVYFGMLTTIIIIITLFLTSAIFIEAKTNVVPIELFCIDEIKSYVKDDITTEDLFYRYIKWHISILDRLHFTSTRSLCYVDYSGPDRCFEEVDTVNKTNKQLLI